MKKIFLIIVILLQVGFLFAQERDNVGHRVGPWNFGTPQQGIAWKIRRSYYSDNSEKFTNEIEIKNTNNSNVTFSYNISENSNETTTRYRKTLAPNGTYTSTYCPNAQSVYFFVDLSNGQVTNQQNDPNFDRNNASFQEYYKRATVAGQAGNYDEAISLWNSAISVAVNDDQRNNARAWLAEAEKARNSSNNQKQNQEIANRNAEAQRQQQLLKQQQKADALNQLSNSLNDLASTLDKQKQEKAKEKESKIKEQAKQMANENREKQNSQVNNIVSSNEADKLYEQAKIALKENDLPKYNELVEKSAIQGNSDAMVDISSYYRGAYMNQPIDASKADYYLLKAIDLGNGRAMHQYGYNHEIGNGVQMDKNLALKWYLQSAEKGYSIAMCKMGDFYSKYSYREVVPKNLITAKMWYKKACNLGFERGCAEVLKIEQSKY